MQIRRSLPLILFWTVAHSGCIRWSANPLAPEIADPVRTFTEQWPTEVKRPFFATITALGNRVTASGIFDYSGPRDFRMTAITENGMILFDARRNWAGTHVLRSMPGLDTSIVEQIVRDLSLGWRMPESFTRMRVSGRQTLVQDTTADGIQATYFFGGEPLRLQKSQFALGTLDTLSITYKSYDSRGRAHDLSVQRPARFYSIQLTFTDEPQ